MKKSLSILFILTFLISCKSKQDLTTYDLIIQNVKLFDGDNVIENATVFIDRNTVKEIIKGTQTNYVGDNIIDGDGYTLTPGFINAHVHAFNEAHSKQAVQSGVLTLIDLFSPQPVSKLLRNFGKTSNKHAYFYSSGPTITVAGGHGSQFGPVPLVSNVDDIPEFIENRIAEGSDYIKLIIEKGAASSQIPTLSDEMIKRAIQSCIENNVLSIAHISRKSDALKAVNMGINGLAHLWSRDSLGITDLELKQLKKSGVFIIPTLLVIKKLNEAKSRDVDMNILKETLLRLYKSGIPLLAGTDPPNFQINYGSDLFKEMELFVESGMSEVDVLKSATSETSKAFKLSKKGYIKEGYPADLVLIKGDPTTNIKDIYNIKHIWKNGNEVTLNDNIDE